ncbi:exopolysaccharide biosynthesis protein [Palleronia sediminis]|uniref:Exopolysaccharide biosynthesis protein n=1 Tax=Palleronia sediminis TaxID=2547833 RepID=A0A4R6A7M0_9RHOB|nr:exopolysaccharide biosynthesis protein [Palleronia sediminis]TDL79761.1 exopolysaccharide biosynthesis protein [Palleronia sediminis]
MDTAENPPENNHRVRDIVDRLDELTDKEEVSVETILDAFGTTGFLPILMIPALLVVSPLSGIPLFSSVCGLAIALIATQIFIRRKRVWLPGFVMRRTIKGEKLHNGAQKLHWVADWIDRRARDRLHPLISRAARPFVHFSCIVCGAAMPVLEIVPFSSSILGAATLCFATALLARDGLFVLFGYILMFGASLVPISVFFGVISASGG